MLQYKFDKADDLMSFISNTTELMEWGVIICRLSTANGLSMDIDTKIASTSGTMNYTRFKFLLPMLDNFYKTVVQYEYSDLNIEIKFQLPISLKNSFDPNGEYVDFYLSVHSDKITIIASSSHLEVSRNSGLAPISNWDVYFAQLYTIWYNKHTEGIF